MKQLASLTDLIERFSDLTYFSDEIVSYLKTNRFTHVHDDWFATGRTWRVDIFADEIANVNRELELV
jgi:hypothetical protein